LRTSQELLRVNSFLRMGLSSYSITVRLLRLLWIVSLVCSSVVLASSRLLRALVSRITVSLSVNAGKLVVRGSLGGQTLLLRSTELFLLLNRKIWRVLLSLVIASTLILLLLLKLRLRVLRVIGCHRTGLLLPIEVLSICTQLGA
jgi:hypothetical protein